MTKSVRVIPRRSGRGRHPFVHSSLPSWRLFGPSSSRFRRRLSLPFGRDKKRESDRMPPVDRCRSTHTETTVIMSILRRVTRSHWFWFVLGIAVVGVTAASIFSSGGASSPRAWIEPADPREAPAFTLDRLNGESFHLKEHRGEVVVLNFWATWCPPCREEIPDFVNMQEDLGDRGVQFVGVALERNPDPQAVRDFAEKMNVNYPIGLDDGTIAQKYGGVRTLPTTFVIGPEGEIQGRIPGRTTESMLKPALEQLLEETS